MPMPLQDIEVQALQLPLEERGRLAGRLLESLEPEPHDTPENIAKAWDEELARRIEEMEAGRTESVPYEQVRAELRALIDSRRGR
ncbi:MAG TPA: addiction module protein [Burkholderiaceae bacterium]|nr:addiction module protein [Burkholderiaceae bacterium]